MHLSLPPENIKNFTGFFMFLGGRKRMHWKQMGSKNCWGNSKNVCKLSTRQTYVHRSNVPVSIQQSQQDLQNNLKFGDEYPW